jgi:long-chain acyl-CoA synthetase
MAAWSSGSTGWPRAPIADTSRAGTGGTTGRSKGVMLSHRNLVSNARNGLAIVQHDLSDPCHLHAAPMFHLADVGVMNCMLLLGGAHAFIRMFTPEAVARAIEKFRVTDVLLVPTMIQMFVDQPNLSNYDLRSLRSVSYGASPMSEAVLDRAISALPNAEFVQGYGMTELSPTATLLPWKDHLPEARAKGRHRSGGAPRRWLRFGLSILSGSQFHCASLAKSWHAVTP